MSKIFFLTFFFNLNSRKFLFLLLFFSLISLILVSGTHFPPWAHFFSLTTIARMRKVRWNEKQEENSLRVFKSSRCWIFLLSSLLLVKYKKSNTKRYDNKRYQLSNSWSGEEMRRVAEWAGSGGMRRSREKQTENYSWKVWNSTRKKEQTVAPWEWKGM